MEIFGIGSLELILILVIAIIVLGPDGMVKSARSMGRFMRKIIKSPIWAQLMDTQRELREMPTRLVREAGLEEDIKELKKTSQEIKKTSQELRNIDVTGGVSLKPTWPVPHQTTTETGETPAEENPPPAVEEHSIAPPDLASGQENTQQPPDTEKPDQNAH